ncbi:interleukin-25-like [Chelmon rostratus]|uniref:interleukin-25-like n=1 Tax=Chelmon rostratus TaxID=109905 RepID=UPI001BE8CCD2|nr:interleukin-25-like [Chelmon rostratus]
MLYIYRVQWRCWSQCGLSGFRMTWVRLQTIFLCSLLISNSHTSSSSSSSSSSSADAAGSSRCISADEMSGRVDKFQRRYWDKLRVSTDLQPLRDARTCAQTAAGMPEDLNNRSLSPWRYSLHEDVDRIPREIAFAECLCQGCIINQREELSYNSVQVFAWLMVLRRTRCPRDPDKYVLKRDFLKVPVACTCAVPRYAK